MDVLSVTEGAQGAGEGMALRKVSSLVFPQLAAKITQHQLRLGRLKGLKGEAVLHNFGEIYRT